MRIIVTGREKWKNQELQYRIDAFLPPIGSKVIIKSRYTEAQVAKGKPARMPVTVTSLTLDYDQNIAFVGVK